MKPTDAELLTQHRTDPSGTAAGTLVSRHAGLVYSAALRVTGNPSDAEDAMQGTWITLFRKAHGLSGRENLAGWLYRTAVFIARQVVRDRNLRTQREQEGGVMQAIFSETDTAWEQLRPQLDEALMKLPERLRAPVILHFLEGKTQRETAETLGLREDAIRKRIGAAVEKLRKHFARRGYATPVGILTAILAAKTMQAAPPALVASVVQLAPVAATGGVISGMETAWHLSEAIMKTWMWKKVAVTAGIALLALGTGAVATSKILSEKESAAKTVVSGPATKSPNEKRAIGETSPKTASPAVRAASKDPKVVWKRMLEIATACKDPATIKARQELGLPVPKGMTPAEAAAAFNEIGIMVSENDIVETLKEAKRSPDSVDAFINAFLKIWILRDPKTAVEWSLAQGFDTAPLDYKKLPKEERILPLVLYCGMAYARADRDAALAYARAMPGGDGRIHLITGIMGSLCGIKGSDPDFPLAASLLAEIPAGTFRDEMLKTLVKGWIRKDAAAARAWAEGLPAGADRDIALAVFEGDAPRDGTLPPAILSRAQSTKMPVDFLERWNQDPRETFLWFQGISDPKQKKEMAKKIADWLEGDHEKWLIKKNPALAAELLEMVAKKDFFSRVKIADVWAETDPKAAWQWAGKSPNRDRESICQRVMDIWSKKDLASASQFAVTLVENRTPALQAVLAHWAERDPSGALNWTQSLPDPKEKSACLSSVFLAWANKDPAGAMNAITALPKETLPDQDRRNAYWLIVRRLYDQDLEGTLATVGQLSAEDQKHLLSHTLEALTKQNPERALAYLQAVGDDKDGNYIQSIAAAWAQKDPEAAARWAATLPQGNAKERIFNHLISSWGIHDCEKALAWIKTLPQDRGRDIALKECLKWMHHRKPEAAFLEALTIQDPKIQKEALTGLFVTWHQSKPDEAKKALENANLPEEVKAGLLKKVRKP